MQQKQSGMRYGVFLLVVVGLLIGGMAVLMTRDIPAPQKPVEKQLDAKAILEQK